MEERDFFRAEAELDLRSPLWHGTLYIRPDHPRELLSMLALRSQSIDRRWLSILVFPLLLAFCAIVQQCGVPHGQFDNICFGSFF